ncbi:bifunctional glutamate N-acetyltransferase/amino-acid acetyltransferase ArgJ [Desulfobotulus sp. H1]|uniref:Arginine biosynthesis bifunctional protein ArgJ n=2 Tax=Desulfobotulus pelophilus TaxID=2823377 RepID=A0ABT3N780_9BACT|nr:bifunctional glutamate N-acetyltransferase/amino-acid acetyltransferase ArgJ [Desulfobotulus pelophilus]
MYCKGFRAGAVCAGIKHKDRPDLAMLACDHPAAAAAVFTRNQVTAAPVRISRDHIRSGRCQALIVNSGNANCATGRQGMENAKAMAEAAAFALGTDPELIQVASTGVIGQQLPMDRILPAVPKLASSLRNDGLEDLAHAIMTTDLVRKTASQTLILPSGEVTVCGVAKGSGMICPDMATMLSFIMTDADLNPAALSRLLTEAVNRSFNRITVDGDTSTNDTVLLMASGASGVRIRENDEKLFADALNQICMDLATQVVLDGEGATKLVRIEVTGAATSEDALKAAETVANSPLVKTALFGEDANWGRLAMAVGRSGAKLDPDRITLSFDNALLVKDGIWLGPEAEAKASSVMKQKKFTILIDLGVGEGQDFMLTCDFSYDYVRINADYRS